MNRAKILQNDALRAIAGRRRRDSVADLFTTFDILTIDEILACKEAVTMFKMMNGKVPEDACLPLPLPHHQSARRPFDLRVPHATRGPSRHSLHFRLPSRWNSLPNEIRSLKSVAMFESETKKFVKRQSIL
jgi:hypothetical protein